MTKLMTSSFKFICQELLQMQVSSPYNARKKLTKWKELIFPYPTAYEFVYKFKNYK